MVLIYTMQSYTQLPIYTVKPGYNDITVDDTSPIDSDFFVAQIHSSLLTVTLYFSVITTLVYNDTKYSVPFKTL